MTTYRINDDAVSFTEDLIAKHRYVLSSEWNEAQPDTDAENEFIDKHGWERYASWHLGLVEGASDETKGRYGFVLGDFTRVHRSALIACVYRAAEWDHKEIELAAHDLLQKLDKARS